MGQSKVAIDDAIVDEMDIDVDVHDVDVDFNDNDDVGVSIVVDTIVVVEKTT
jgi:hypothetical protein